MLRPKQLIERVDARLARHGKLGATLIKGVAGTAGIRLAHAGIGLITAVILAKMLAPAGYGIYSFVMALVALFSIPSELGIPRLAIREVAVANARKEWGHMRGFVIRSHQLIGALTVILALAALVMLLLWGDRVDAQKRQTMWIALLVIPAISLGALRGSMLRGLRKTVLGQLPEQIFRPLIFLLLIPFLPLLLGSSVSVPDVMAAQVLASALAFIGGLYLFLRHRPPELLGAVPQYKTAEWLRSTVPFGMIAALQLINGRTDVLMLGFFREDSEVGIYRAASQLSILIIFGLRAVNAIQGPHIAHLYATGDMERLQTMVTRSTQVLLLSSLPIALVLALFGQFIINTLFGQEFSAAYWPLVILCFGQVINAGFGSVGILLNMTGHEHDTTKSLLAGAVVNVLANILLTPAWGAIGAAIATTATLVVWNFMMWRKVHARLGIQSSPYHRRRS